ncbi:c-type cytochrome [Azospirillum halopraeferens]|uniref:c-type cytochrome n=1 Tax=Azospirillum halopraeferens TaxID=34010 RepID=UPI000401F31A|nr:cytochrome c [Azospirillum halopraeferens]
MRISLIAPVMAVAATMAAAGAAGTRTGDPDTGQALAQRWCTACHVVGSGDTGTDAAPAFATLARRHGDDPGWMRAWLSRSHPRMPDLHLSRAEIEDVIAYLGTLPR